MKKLGIGLIGLLILVVLISGCTSNAQKETVM